jgi:Papain family cysteine protease
MFSDLLFCHNVFTQQSKSCRFKQWTVGATCKGSKLSTPNDEEALQRVVAGVGPISVYIDAGQRSFQLYNSGVYNEPKCSRGTDHAVLIVGYGTVEGRDYWLVKNRLVQNSFVFPCMTLTLVDRIGIFR